VAALLFNHSTDNPRRMKNQGGGGNIQATTHLSRLIAAAAVMTGVLIQSLMTAALGHLMHNTPAQYTALGTCLHTITYTVASRLCALVHAYLLHTHGCSKEPYVCVWHTCTRVQYHAPGTHLPLSEDEKLGESRCTALPGRSQWRPLK